MLIYIKEKFKKFKFLQLCVCILFVNSPKNFLVAVLMCSFLYFLYKTIFDTTEIVVKNNSIADTKEKIIYSKEDIVALLDDCAIKTTQKAIDPDVTYKDLAKAYALHDIILSDTYTYEVYTLCVRYTCHLKSGTKLAKVKNLCLDVARDIEAKSLTVSQDQGLVVFNLIFCGDNTPFHIKALLQSKATKDHLTLRFGKYVDDEIATITLDADSPHILACGTTGSGKSVLLHTLITCAIIEYLPSELNLQLIDTKMIELTAYEDIHHTKALATSAAEANTLLKNLVDEMESRYVFMREIGVRSISELDKHAKPPYILVVCDELGDLMMSEYKTDITSSIIKLAQKARASGIHLVLATQKPHSSILSTTIKACLNARIALKVASRRDSVMILDATGAEMLTQKGDFIIQKTSGTKVGRATYIQKDEHKKILSFLEDL